MVFGSLCALSFGSLGGWKIFGMTLFNLFDYVSSNILLPLGGLLISLFVGWVLDRSVIRRELSPDSTRRGLFGARIVVFCLRYIAPVCIAAVFIYGLDIF